MSGIVYGLFLVATCKHKKTCNNGKLTKLCTALVASHLLDLQPFRAQIIRNKFDFETPHLDYQALFRFQKEDILKLKDLLEIPDEVQVTPLLSVHGLEALCIFLCRMSYPNRLKDLESFFGRSYSSISSIFNHMMNYFYEKFKHLVHWDSGRLTTAKLQEYAAAIHAKGLPLDNVIGFIDGTFRETCRPSKNQKVAYSGHKRSHGLKYQSIQAPDVIILNMFGPVAGRNHDCYILSESKILNVLDIELKKDGNYWIIYGDKGYGLRDHVLSPYKGAQLTLEQSLFNTAMSKGRISVEWGFGMVSTLWAFCDYFRNQKIYLQQVGKQYVVATILTNLFTCFYGSKISEYFNLSPPTPEQYLATTVGNEQFDMLDYIEDLFVKE